MFVIRSDNGKQITAGKVTCALAGKKLVWHGWYHKAAGCRWAIPAGAKLGRITGSLSVTAKGLTVKRKFTANVKRNASQYDSLHRHATRALAVGGKSGPPSVTHPLSSGS